MSHTNNIFEIKFEDDQGHGTFFVEAYNNTKALLAFYLIVGVTASPTSIPFSLKQDERNKVKGKMKYGIFGIEYYIKRLKAK